MLQVRLLWRALAFCTTSVLHTVESLIGYMGVRVSSEGLEMTTIKVAGYGLACCLVWIFIFYYVIGLDSTLSLLLSFILGLACVWFANQVKGSKPG